MQRYTEEEFIEAVKNSFSIRQVTIKLNLHSQSSGNYKTVKSKIENLKLDISHFKNTNSSWNKGKTFSPKKSVEEYLKGNYSSYEIKHRLYKEGLLEEKCSQCGIGNIWNNEPLVLQLDHIDGNNKNNDLSNLRILCPNCHTQTNTYASKKLRTKPIKIKGYVYRPRINQRKVERPDKDTLEKLINEIPMIKIGEMYGVQGNAVKKWAKIYGIELPNRRGYWAKLKAGKI